MDLIKLKDVHKTYYLGEVEVPVLRGITLSVARGELVALMGASGSGKSTLMNLLGCLDNASSGEYWLAGEEISRLTANEYARLRNRTIGFVFQSFNLLPRTTALENVMMPLTYSRENLSEQQKRQRAADLLRKVGLADRINHQQSQLSGGEQQRVAIARSLVNQPSILLADEPTGNLDSRTSKEILEMFQQLNSADGITVILVTHDQGVAQWAQRTIRIKDGLLEGSGEPVEAGNVRMRIYITIKTALNALRRNVMRTILTTLGIVIGVAAVISMMEIGNGATIAIQKTMASIGANTLAILPGAANTGGINYGAGSLMTLTPQDADAIIKDSPALASVAPVVRARTQIVYGNRNWSPTYIYGTTPSFLQVREWTDLEEGESFDEHDVRNSNRVCLIGKTIVRELFGGLSPLGKEVRLRNVAFKVVGVLKMKGANMMGMDQDDILLAPWTTIKYRVVATSLGSSSQSENATTISSSNNPYETVSTSLYPVPSTTEQSSAPQPIRFANVDQILTAARSSGSIPSAIQQITMLLRERHHLKASSPNDFNVRDMTEITKAMSSTTDMITKLLLCVAMISLMVGGVGIMNIMLVSVTERTREIGLRMAVGAEPGDILRQFLTEAVVICLLGGTMGIILGRTSSYIISSVLHWPTAPSVKRSSPP